MSVGSKRKDTGPSQRVKDLVRARDRGCVICGETYDCQKHHRLPRKMGGTRRPEVNGAANIVLLCPEHHAWVESYREIARDRGLLVRVNQTPADVALVRHGEWGHLDDDGGWTPCEAPS